MSQNSEVERLTVFAKDFARLYVEFTKQLTDRDDVSIESFGEIFKASKVEYLHYCGGTTLERPFFQAITDDLLQLSAAYLSIPSAVASRNVRTFGLLLTLFLYSTQPARPRSTEVEEEAENANANVVNSEKQLQTAETDDTTGGITTESELEAAAAPPLPPLPRLPMRLVPISVSVMRLLLSCMPAAVSVPPSSSADDHNTSESNNNGSNRWDAATSVPLPLSYTEARALLTLHRARAWHVVPYVRDGPHVAALIAAHAACGAPLVTQVAAPLPPATFAATLTARSLSHVAASPDAVGGADSLFRDPDFARLRQGYAKARQQLL